MKAVQLHNFGDSDELFIGEIPGPSRKPGEVLVKVHASAMNRADILQRQGKYPPPEGESDILGLEMAGEIKETGGPGSQWKVGDRVMALLGGGGQAEYVCAHESLLMPVPSTMEYTEAAAIPEVFLTAYQTMFEEGKAIKDDSILIHAGASGVGTAAIQLACQAGMTAFVTCSATKRKTCIDLGASLAIDYKSEVFDEVILEKTNNKGVDVILDFIGGSNMNSNIRALATGGKLVLIAMMGGPKAMDINLMPILQKHLTVIGTTLRSRPLEYKKQLIQTFASKYLPLFESGEIKPVIDSIYKLGDIAKAHRHMEDNKNIGKIVIEMD